MILTSKKAKAKRRDILKTMRYEMNRHNKSIKKWDDKMKMWLAKDDSYSFKFEGLS